jgi:hypothetical protein
MSSVDGWADVLASFVGSCRTGALVENCLIELVRQGRAAAAAVEAAVEGGDCRRRRRNGWAIDLLRGSKRAS